MRGARHRDMIATCLIDVSIVWALVWLPTMSR